ncbi:hypothetical protein EMCRGX_G013374 [Ephydatia muelleri]|eukprot:Em0004g1040a
MSSKRSIESYATLPRTRSSAGGKKSMDEGSALINLTKQADEQLADDRKKEAEAMKYWEAMKEREQEKFSDEENESSTSKPRSIMHSSSNMATNKDDPVSKKEKEEGSSSGLETIKLWQSKYQEVESKYKDAMVTNAQLYTDKTQLVYHVESLKDKLEDQEQAMVEVKFELQREQSQVLHLKHQEDVLRKENNLLKEQIRIREEFMESRGLRLPGEAEEATDMPPPPQEAAGLGAEEREKFVKEITSLKEEIASMRENLPGGQQHKDILAASSRMVSEYKTKLQIAETELARAEAQMERLKGQANRYKTQLEESEKREDELLKEKRSQAREVRRLQSECEDYRTEIDLLKKRMEQFRKRNET